MLETEIKKLTEAVNTLNETLIKFNPNAFFVLPEPIDQLIEEHAKADKIVEEQKVVDPSPTFTGEITHPNQTAMSFGEEPSHFPTLLTHENLKDACLTKVREDMKFKPIIKALLAEYGAMKAADVPVEKIGEVIEKIEAMV
jgi:hypothetical protein